MRRSIVESYICLHAYDEAKTELDRLICDYPENPWSYIEYGDMYNGNDDAIKDINKAKEYYNKALSMAKDEFDKEAVEERLEDISG